jgi:predicted dinucleotide-binding enzyme
MFGRIAREHTMHITIAGSGNVGRALAGGWLKTGHRVTFATRDVAGDKAGELREQGFGLSP